MQKFFKENFALVFGVSLPLILIAIFFLASQKPYDVANNPKYSLVFANNYNPNWTDHPWRINIENKQLRIRYNSNADKNRHYYNKPQIYIFNHESMRSDLLDIDYENIVDGHVKDSVLDDINNQNFITKKTSPDGYRLEHDYNYSNRGLMGEIFGFGRRYRNSYVLKKDSITIPLNTSQRVTQAHFIAWIDNEQ